MDVEVNEENIDLYGLAQLTENSREDMLSRAAEARENGYILSVNIPDELLHLNVFDAHVSQLVERQTVPRCRYVQKPGPLGMVWECMIHHELSKWNVVEGSDVPCLAIDPVEAPQTDEDYTGPV